MAGWGSVRPTCAIGHELQRSRPELRVLYLAAEQFVNELINSSRFDRMPAFRERYRTIDVLMIDDVQFLANKERMQEEFFHTFNTLYTSQKQIILSSFAGPRVHGTLLGLRSSRAWRASEMPETSLLRDVPGRGAGTVRCLDDSSRSWTAPGRPRRSFLGRPALIRWRAPCSYGR
jgi:hypothetical protein